MRLVPWSHEVEVLMLNHLCKCYNAAVLGFSTARFRLEVSCCIASTYSEKCVHVQIYCFHYHQNSVLGSNQNTALVTFCHRRYYIGSSKLAELGWVERTSWEDGLRKTVEWYMSVQSTNYW